MLSLYATASLDFHCEDEIRLACSLSQPPRIIVRYCGIVFTSPNCNTVNLCPGRVSFNMDPVFDQT